MELQILLKFPDADKNRSHLVQSELLFTIDAVEVTVNQ